MGLELIPADPTLGSYERAFELVDLQRQFLNSAVVAAFVVPLTVLTGSWAGFAMTLLRRRARSIVVGLSLIVLMIPLSALWVPRVVMFRQIDVLDSYIPLVAPALTGTNPFYVLLFY